MTALLLFECLPTASQKGAQCQTVHTQKGKR